ncbi:hypothetical protein [Nocardia sp. NBC_01329]|uniref:hypothetical protein n=1 Tax=Nocardia sp. NBC_01329 TaxID=2903594 RepID=UPI002E15D27C|nr:hypothetical protein OG405_09170 [Nocardia sp. NBC_01329]
MRATTKTVAGGEHPLLNVLMQPLLDLRASLGDGARPTDVLAALAAAADRTAAAEAPGRAGRYLLESTDTAPAAVPVAARTETEAVALADHHTSLSTVLTDAYATRDTAASRLDSVIEDFRTKAGPMLATAQSQSDVDAVIGLAAQTIRDGVTEVNYARDEMDDHTRRTRALGRGPDAPTVTVPDGFATAPGVTAGAGVPGGVPGGGVPVGLDPQQAMQLALQQAALAAGVQLGTVALDAGVEIGSKLIDGVVQVATHGIDTGAALAEQGISTLAAGAAGAAGPGTEPGLHPGGGAPTAPAGSGDQPGAALFGGLGGTRSPSTPSGPKDEDTTSGDASPPVIPAPGTDSEPVFPVPDPTPVLPRPGDQPGTTGAVLPPVTRPGAGQDQETPRPRRPGQAGVVLETS